MKFSDGYWLKRPGVTVYSPKEVRDIQITDKKVVLYVAPWDVEQRGMTLTGPLFTMTFQSPQPGIMTFENAHFLGGVQNKAQFELNDADCTLETTQSENLLTIKSGDITAEIVLNNFDVTFRYQGRYLTSTGNRKLGYATTPEGSFMLEQLDMSVGEKVYGLGERFTPFVKNGQAVDIWNEDGGTASEQSYKNIPFYLSSNDYGIFVDNTGKVSYEIASEVVSRIQFSVPGESLKYHIIGAESRKDVLGAYTNLTGRPALPPAWTMGLWLTTSFTTDYNEETVMSFIDGMAERNIPLHVFHYDCFWMKEYEWCNFKWDEDMFPDVDGMLKRLKDKGLKICVWINSYIGQKSPLFKEAADLGYLIKTTDGGVWQWDKWQPGMGIVDFTNPDACRWYQDKLKVLLDQGVDCFKTDFGERIPFENVQYHNGLDPVSMHNYYTQLYNQTVFELLERERGVGEACLFARSATAGGQKFPVHWGGDCSSNYLSMAESLRGGLSLTLSGFGFWSHDMSGFEATAIPDVYKRWAAFGMLSTHSRLHGSGSYRVPWLFDEESVDVLRSFTNLKCRMMPYLFSTAVNTSKTGVPTMRAMLLEFENDRTCLDIDTQYMLGDSIMVAPVFSEDKSVTYYLPEGSWTHFLSGEKHEGGKWYTEAYDYYSLPLFVRENSFVPMGANDQLAEYDFADGLDLRLYELKDGATAETTVYQKDGSQLLAVKAVRSGAKVEITLDGVCPDITLVNVQNVTGVNGAEAVQVETGVKLTGTSTNINFELAE